MYKSCWEQLGYSDVCLSVHEVLGIEVLPLDQVNVMDLNEVLYHI
jgi:hypothetical protein